MRSQTHREVRRIIRYHVPDKLLSPETCSSCAAFVFCVQGSKAIAVRLFAIV